MAQKELPATSGQSSAPTALPEFKRQESIDTPSSVPDFGGAMRDLGAARYGGLGAIGAKVAQQASQAQAEKLGYEQGQTPKGDLLPPITDFDKHYADAYHTQAAATLGLQADKLMSDSDIEMGKATRITPELISKTRQQVGLGLSKILEQAPTAIKGKLDEQFTASMIRSNHQYETKMIQQQKDDQKDTLLAALSANSKQAFELASSGNYKAARDLAENSKAMANNGHANNLMDKQAAQTAYDTINTAAINGNLIHKALEARANGKLPEFEKEYASKKPDDLTYEQWHGGAAAVSGYMGALENMKTQDEQLRSIKFSEAIVQDVKGITGDMLADLKSNVSPVEYEQSYLKYVTALKKQAGTNAEADVLMKGFGNPEVFSRAGEPAKNQTFDTLVKKKMDEGTGITTDQAEAQIAASAAGPIPRFTNLLNTKLNSTDPAQIESAGKQIEYMTQAEKGGNLKGVNDDSMAMSNLYGALRRSHPAEEAAEIAYNSVYNQTPEEKTVVNDNWAQFNRDVKSSQGDLSYYTDLSGINKDNLIDPQGFVEQSQSLMESYFKLTKGDVNTAKKMTQQAIKSSYGESHVNGQRETTFYPLENVVNLPADSAGFIQDDIVEQVSGQLASTKKAFEEGKSQFYWEIEPRRSQQGSESPGHRNIASNPLVYMNPNITNAVDANTKSNFAAGSAMVIHRHWKNGVRETYPLIVKADPWLTKTNSANKPYAGSWDIVLGTERGWKPLQRLNPGMGQFIYYNPAIDKIRANYAKAHGTK